MATNYLQDGGTIDFTNTGKESLKAGAVVMVGDLAGVAHDDILPGMTGVLHTRGVFILPKAAEAVKQGQWLYFGGGTLSGKAEGNQKAGIAWSSAGAADAQVAVRLAE